MTAQPKTLFALAGRVAVPPALKDATLVLVDYQNEYLEGPIALPGAAKAVGHAAELLRRARAAGARIVHVAHKGAPGGMFDRTGHRGAIIEALAPADGEPVVEKTLPNGFAKTDLAERIGSPGGPLIVLGFMTHNCVSATARAALDLGHAVTVVADASATRALPTPSGGVISAEALHEAELAGLADRTAQVFDGADIV